MLAYSSIRIPVSRALPSKPMHTEEDLRRLYLAFENLRSTEETSLVLSTIITKVAAELHTPGQKDLREFRTHGARFQVDVGDRFGRLCYYGGQPEALELSVFRELCASSSSIWDIGSNFGLYAIVAGKAAANARIIAVDANERAISLLKRNLQLNKLADRVTVSECAVAASNTTMDFYETEDMAFSGLSDTGRSPVVKRRPVEVRTLDLLWEHYGAAPIDLLKIDVEGHELEVLRGGKKALAASPDIIVLFEHSSKNLSEEAEELLMEHLAELSELGMSFWPARVDTDPQPLSFGDDKGELMRVDGNVFMARAGTAAERRLVEGIRLASSKKRSKRLSGADWARCVELITDQMRTSLGETRSQYQNKIETLRETLGRNEAINQELKSTLASRDEKIAALKVTLAQLKDRYASLERVTQTSGAKDRERTSILSEGGALPSKTGNDPTQDTG